MPRITYSEEFAEICRPIYGLSAKEAQDAVENPDRVEAWNGNAHPGVFIFLKYGRLLGDHSILIVAIDHGFQFEIFYGLKAFPSLTPRFFQLGPNEILETLLLRFGAAPEVFDISWFHKHLGFIINPGLYLPWVASKGRDAFSTQVEAISRFAEERTVPAAKGKPFRDAVFETLHGFCYYCRQNPKVLSSLHEEQIRDLYIIVAKCVFKNATSETYHHKGKLDFKIVDPDDAFQFVTGEFKWWRGASSARKAYEQATESHASGQESEIYIIILSSMAAAKQVYRKTLSTIEAGRQTEKGSYKARGVGASTEAFGQVIVRVRNSPAIPLTFGIANLHYKMD